MQLTDIVNLKYIKVPLQAQEKYQAIAELVDLLNRENQISDYDSVIKAVMERESIRSTGVGQGFAIPHGKANSVDRLLIAIGKTAEPIDFDSIDGKPVSMIVLLISPIGQTGPHVQALARISRFMTDMKIRKGLWASDSPEQIYHYICQFDRNQKP